MTALGFTVGLGTGAGAGDAEGDDATLAIGFCDGAGVAAPPMTLSSVALGGGPPTTFAK
jgi:hypothetical protein